jgi:hypothetical protein
MSMVVLVPDRRKASPAAKRAIEVAHDAAAGAAAVGEHAEALTGEVHRRVPDPERFAAELADALRGALGSRYGIVLP